MCNLFPVRFFYYLLTCGVLQLIGCQRSSHEMAGSEITVPTDQGISVGRQEVFDEIAGSAYRKRATKYFVIIDKDTSSYMPIFAESREDGVVGLNLNIRNSSKSRSYGDWMEELAKILPQATQEYDFDSLKSIYVGRLVATGDLAIEVTRQYHETFNGYDDIRTTDYPRISDFLVESKLAEDFNKLFRPYGISVARISVEKVFFTTSESFSAYGKIETDSAMIPAKILDCQTWIKLKNDQTAND